MAYPRDRPAALDSYDYPDDSDMEDVDDEDIALEGEGGDRAPSHEVRHLLLPNVNRVMTVTMI